MSLFQKLGHYVKGSQILADWVGSGGEVVSRDLAEKRADICAICPRNKEGLPIAEWVSDVIREQMGVRKFLELTTPQDENLHTCELCDCPLQLKIWQLHRRVKLDEDEVEKYPSYCWLRKEA